MFTNKCNYVKTVVPHQATLVTKGLPRLHKFKTDSLLCFALKRQKHKHITAAAHCKL